MKKIILIFILLVPGYAFSMDVNPAKSVLGVPWDSTEEQTRKILGEPNGYFQATKYKKVVFYGKSVVLLFVRGQLKGFRYYDTCCQVLYQMPVSINAKFSNEPLSLEGRVLSGKNFTEINKALPYELGSPDYRAEIATDEATIKFGFVGRGYPDKASEFHFNSLEIDYAL